MAGAPKAVTPPDPPTGGGVPAAAETVVPERAAQLDPFGDVPLEVRVEIGRREIQVREILSLEPGAIVRLERSAGENVDLFIAGVLAATGEIVVLDDKVGLRITDFAAAPGDTE